MKFKRSLSLVLALCMMISLLPAASVSAAESAEKFTYNFTTAGQAEGNWTRASYYKTNYQNYHAAGARIMANNGCATAGNNGIAYKIEIPEGTDAMYRPVFTYAGIECGGIVNIYLLSAEDEKTAWWYKEGSEGVNMEVSSASGGTSGLYRAINDNIANGESSVVKKIIADVDTYNALTATAQVDKDFTQTVPVSGEAISLKAGTYYLIFGLAGANEKAVTWTADFNSYYYRPVSFEFQKVDTILSLSCDVTTIDAGATTQINAVVTGYDGEPVNTTVSFESGKESVATVSDTGVVTGVAEGSTTITATAQANGKTLSKTIDITVLPADEGNAGVELEYIFSTNVMTSEARAAALAAGADNVNNGLDSKGNLRYLTFIDDLTECDSSKTAPWAWSSLGSYKPDGLVLSSTMFNITAEKAKYGTDNQQFLVLKAYIANKGPYNFSVRANGAYFGTGADVYILPAQGVNEITRTTLEGLTSIGHFETKGDGDLGYMKVGKVDIEKRGEYFVVFDFNTDNEETLNDKGKHYFYGKAMKLTAASGDFDKVELSLRGIEEGDPVALKSVHDINVTLTDKNGTELDEIDESKLTVEITSDDEDVAVITADNKLDAASCGEATITAKVTYGDVVRKENIDITVEETGKELLGEEQNPDIESDVWPWDMARQDEEPEEAWWIRAKVGTVEKDGDADNRAFGIEINPNIAASDVYGQNATTGKYNNPPGPAYIRATNGPRVKVKTGQFYLFTFKMKLENWTTPSGADPMAINLDLYPYSSKDASSSTAGYNRGMNITLEENWTEKYKEWQTVTVPVSAEFLTGRDEEYFTPVFVFRPAQADMPKAGYGGTAWFDDFSLREVGFDELEVTVDGEPALGENSALVINVRPRTATGQYISLDASCLPNCVDITTDNEHIIGEIMTPERTSHTSFPGVYYAAADSSLAGMNGTANISAVMTLNGVTRSGETSVTASNFARKLSYAEAEAESVTAKEGNTTQVEVTAYDTNGDEIDLEDAQVIYKSKTKDIISVDENGVVTPLAAGMGQVEVTVIYEKVAVLTTAEVHVTDGTPIVSAELIAESELGYLRDLPLTLRGMSESGYAADIEAAEVEWFVSSDAVSVSDDGYMFGNTLGETVEIYAKVTLNGATATTNTLTVTVVKSDLRSVKIDFGLTTAATPEDVSIEKDGWEFDFTNTHANTKPGLNNIGFQTQNTAAGQVLALKVNIPYAGYYTPVFRGRCIGQKAAGSVDFYLDGTYIGNYSFYFKGMTCWGEAETMRSVYLTAGTHSLYLRTNPNTQISSAYNMGPKDLYFIARESLPQITGVPADELTIEAGSSANINAVMETEDDFTYAWQKRFDGSADTMASAFYESSDENIAKVDASGNITGVTPGEAVITVTAKTENSEMAKQYKVTVIEASSAEEDITLASVEIGYETLVMSVNSDGILLTSAAKNSSGEKLPTTGATIVWSSSDESVATVENGKVTPVSEGIAEITAEITIGEVTKSAAVTVSVRAGKTGRTYYTDERVAAARENASKYSWAKSIKKAATEKADKYLALGLEKLWSVIPGNSIPRTWQVGLSGDPDIYLCRYCGKDVQAEYGVYPWVTDAIGRPWKIQCPDCKRVFPSNDFESFYNMGLDPETGVFNLEYALSEHQKKFGDTYGTGYLKNTMYPEVGSAGSTVKLASTEKAETWCVDDGLGYDTGTYYANGRPKVYTFIPYYHHYGLWYASGDNHSALIKEAITSLSDAYIYTGDAKYGRAGAVMMDRMADLYPEFCTTEWIAEGYYLGSSKNGKMLNNIWQCINDLPLSKAYDSFFPIYDDPEVVSFLNEKAQKYTGLGDKSTAEAIRTNIETNYLSEMYTAAMEADLNGNFGHHQSAIASAAVVLDTQPMTNKMIDWIFNESIQVAYQSNTGGEIGQRFINEVSRDGQGTESGPGYNRIWITQLYDVAEILSLYDDYDGMDIWTNPKYIGMIKSYNPLTLVRRGQPSIGDSGRSGWFAQLPDDQDVIIGAFKGVKDTHFESAVEIAQLIYRLRMHNSGNLDDMHYDIFTKNPESIQDEILDIIDEYGEYPFDKSSMMTGYGFGVLRGGTLHEGGGNTAIRDTTRDFWMYFGGAKTHNHYDKLNLGIEAYGITMTPENGYPEQTGYHPNRHQWTNPTISHNAVVVDEKSQYQSAEPLDPLHFDAKDTRVKVMDIDGSSVYTQTEEYRRTVVMIDYDDEISYGVDFFKVLGGDDHLYSFHSAGEEVASYTEELDFEQQIGGTYAGVDVPFGNDPYTDPSTNYKKLKFPDGYTWLEDVRRSQNPGLENFYIDFDIMDIQNLSRNPWNNMDINLRMTMVNDFKPDEVTLAIGYPPRTSGNLQYVDHYTYMLVRRTGKNLNSLFTTVIEPYNKERYIKSIERIDLAVAEDSEKEPSATDKAAAIKVELRDGRVDYIVYAQNKDITYTVTDNTSDTPYSFDFKGFVGVWTLNGKGENVYSYINDGEKLADITDARATVNGTITDFTHELAFDNFIEVAFDEAVDSAETLEGRLIRVDSPALGNAAFVIEKASLAEDGMSATLDIGSVTLIDSYIDDSDIDGGYNYDIAEGQTFSISLSHEDRHEPVFDEVSDVTTSAGSSVSVKVSATADESADGTITYSARTLPRGASFNASTGTFTWRPDDSQVGDSLVAIDATDSMGRMSTQYFTVTVYGKTTGSSGQETTNTNQEGSASENTGTTGGGGGGGGGSSGGEAADTNPEGSASENTEGIGTTDGTDSGASSGAGGSVRFIDLGNHSWAEDAINSLAADGIVKGTTATTYSPAKNITRADFALLLVRAFNLESDNTENFADVSASDYFAPELAIARNCGIINGIGDNKYAPRNTITRQDMMVIVYRALSAISVAYGDSSPEWRAKAAEDGNTTNPEKMPSLPKGGGTAEWRWEDSPADGTASDNEQKPSPVGEGGPLAVDEALLSERYGDWDTVAPYARDAVASLISAGIVNGKNGLIAPTDYTTRAEVAVLLKRILEHTK